MITKNTANNSKLSVSMYRNVAINYVLRGITIIAGLASTNVNLSYLGVTLYGQWATIASIASWVNYGDLGIGNGFRNEFAKAVAADDIDKQKKLIVSTAKMLGKLTIGLYILLIVISETIFAFDIMDSALRLPMYITNFFFSLELFFGIGRSAAYGYQKSWLTSLAQTTTVLLRIIGVIAIDSFSANLVLFSVISGIAGVIGNIILIFALNHSAHIKIRKPLAQYYDASYKKDIMGLGLKFFILQIAGLVLYSSDNLIINKLIASEAVTKYDIISKIYKTGETLFSVLLISLWSAVTYAIAKKQIDWVKKELKRLLILWLVFSVGVIIVSISFNYIVKIWLGEKAIEYENSIIMLFAIYTIWGTFGSIFVNIANGIGRLRMQLTFAVIEAIVNIPLSIFFAEGLSMGIFGVKLATLCCCIGANLFVPIDIFFYLRRTKLED